MNRMNELLYGTPASFRCHEYSEVEGMNDDRQRDIELTREALEDGMPPGSSITSELRPGP
jgi:hypothetical protein